MKKILLSTMLVCAFAIANAQVVCGSGEIRYWNGNFDASYNPTSSKQAPITINGNPTDWFNNIVGAFAYAGVNKGGFEATPHTFPQAPANVQLDGLRDSLKTSPNYDMDRPGADHRDLRYFAFTYDSANVYFYFRRPKNNTAQVTLYYFVDIDVDGYMKTGEPVIKLTFNNSGSSIEMGLYTAVNSNGTIPGSFDAVKGNRMTAPSSRPGAFKPDGVTPAGNSAGTTQWVEGAADGWNMPGSYTNLNNGVNPPATNSPEVFLARTITDTHPDGTEPGYAVEFAVPWRYLGMYTANGGLTANTSLSAASIFTWHVALQGGNSGVDAADDNAGGCCSGLAVSGAPIVNKTAAWTKLYVGDPFNYRLHITYTNGRNYATKITTASIKIIDPKDQNGAPIPANVVQGWKVVGYKDANCSVGDETNADSTHFNYTNTVGTTYIFEAYDLLKAGVIATGTIGSTACYFLNVEAAGFPALGSATVSYQFETAFDIQSTTCNELESGSAEGSLDVLPVKMTYFNAVRSGQNVNLTWQTTLEDNNTGFEVQRFLGSAGGWQNIGFVSTQAVNGNSNSPLNYQFTDFSNTTKGVTQYRLKQIDKNNRSAFSLIRSVRGDGQKGKTIVYPNPSSDGKVNIIFEDMNGIRDISVSDMSGRVIKQMRGVTNNNITIDNLSAGFYTVRVVNNETGEQTVEKFVVNKR